MVNVEEREGRAGTGMKIITEKMKRERTSLE